MRMKTHRSLSALMLIAILFLTAIFMLLTGCAYTQEAEDEATVHISIQDIPGVTKEEIEAVEALREKYDYFVFGALDSTEAFYNENGEIRGYSALLCEWLTELFEIEFIPELCEWGDLYPELQADFTGELTATEQRRIEYGYLFTGSIAERSTKYFRLPGSQPISEITRIRRLNISFLEGTTTSIVATAKLNELNIPHNTFYVNDYNSAYNMLVNGVTDAFIDEMVVEAAFDDIGKVVVEDFLPLIIEPVSLATQNQELEPIISIVQKALRSGKSNHLADLYKQGMQEYARNKLFSRFDERELVYLRENTTVAYLAEFDNYPVSFYNENERQWQGITFDILDEITALTGLIFEPINKPDVNFSDLLTMLENGEGTMLSEVIRNEPREGRFIWPKNHTLRDNFIAISLDTKPSVSIHRIAQLRVGVQKSTAHADMFYAWFPDHPYVIEYDDTHASFAGLENGEIDLLMFGMRNLLLATNYNENPGFKANIVFDYTFGSFFGFNKNEEILCSIIDKAMEVIDNETIAGQWMRKTYDYRAKIIESQRSWWVGMISLSLVVIILMSFLYRRNRSISDRLAVSQQELSAALQIAEDANNAKSVFLATVSHEIRTPINAIIGIAQIELHKGSLTKEHAFALEKIYRSGNNLLGIINDILDMSKIETGNLELNPMEYDLLSFIDDTVQINTVRIGSKPIEFILDIDKRLPSKLYGDELCLKQILNNLLSNAIKYTEKGHVKLIIKHSTVGEDIVLHFIVEDTGQGMKPEDQDRLFMEYTRFNIEANRNTEGTGLGLSITKRLVELMDGTIKLESEYGKGSVFSVTVRQQAVSCEKIGAKSAESICNFTYSSNRQLEKLQTPHEPIPHGKVLVVDDSETNLYVAQGFLSLYELDIETASSGFAAIEKVESGKEYDIVFMDHMMPKMDGIETTQRLRAMGYKGIIVALSANALSGSDEMFKSSGFDDFISKPLDARRLNTCLTTYIAIANSVGL